VESAILRVTHIYRREDGRWRLVHRHADKTLRSDTSLPQQGSLCRLRSRGPRAPRQTESSVDFVTGAAAVDADEHQ
jgi:hypothetical protein